MVTHKELQIFTAQMYLLTGQILVVESTNVVFKKD